MLKTGSIMSLFVAAISFVSLVAGMRPGGTPQMRSLSSRYYNTTAPTSPCDTGSSTGDFIQAYNATTGADLEGYEYTLYCGSWFEVELIKTVTVSNLNGCFDACYAYNQVFDAGTQSICYSVGLMKINGGLCYLQGVPEGGGVGKMVPAPLNGAHDSAVWIAD